MASNGAMRYGECMKNHAILFGGNAVHDGCREFMLGGHDKPLLCAACGCHRSFHRVFAATAIQGPFLVPTVQGPIVQGPTVQGPFQGPFQGPLGYYNNSNSLMPQMAAEMQFLNFVMLLARMISQASLEGPLAPVQAVRRQEPAGRQTRVRAAAPLAQPQPPPPPPTQPQPPPPANPQPPQRMAPPYPPKAPNEEQKQQANEDQLGSQKGKEEKGDGAGGIA